MPNPVIKPSQQLSKYLKDLYTGEVLSEQGRNFQNFMQPAAAVANFIKNPIDVQTGLPNVDVAGPVMTGITGARNAAKIFDEIKALGKLTPVQTALEFIKRKYPKLSSAIPDYRIIPEQFGPGKMGDYNPMTETARIFDRSGAKLEDYGESIGHEMFHGVQRNFQDRLGELLSPEIGGTYQQIRNFDEYYDINDYLDAIAKYRNQAVEEEAFRAGKTARRATKIYKQHTKGIKAKARK